MAAPSAASKAVGTKLGTSGTAFFGSLCVGTFGLGCWQLERLLGKWDAIEDREQQLKLEPIWYGSRASTNSSNLMNQLLADDDTEDPNQAQPYRRRLLRGRFRHDKEVLIGARGAPPGVALPVSGLSARNGAQKTKTASGMQPGPQGFFVLTPMEVAPEAMPTSTTPATTTVWINRGWVPKTLVPGADRPYRRNDMVQRARIEQALREPPAWNRPPGLVEVTAVVSKAESE
jgi:surfeit locus 1 family protein